MLPSRLLRSSDHLGRRSVRAAAYRDPPVAEFETSEQGYDESFAINAKIPYFLTHPGTRWVTAQTIYVNGGMIFPIN